jgi:hypothetical protein
MQWGPTHFTLSGHMWPPCGCDSPPRGRSIVSTHRRSFVTCLPCRQWLEEVAGRLRQGSGCVEEH